MKREYSSVRALSLVAALVTAACGETESMDPPGTLVNASVNAAGHLHCASETCTIAAGETCCMQQGPAPSCSSNCPADSDSFACDGPEDCPGQVCCEGPTPTGSHATCAASCIPGRTLRVCHDNSECTAGVACCPVNAQVYPGFNACTDDCGGGNDAGASAD